MPTPLVGTPSRDLLTGTPDTELFLGLSENDIILGLAGDDEAYGNENDDYIAGNQGNDLIYGGAGNDTLRGGADNDVLSGDRDRDLLLGDRGDDTIGGGDGEDSLFGNQGNDLIFGNLGEDILYGGKGNDTLYGGKGNDFLAGDLGNDYLVGNLGVDTLEGGAGTDLFVVGTADSSDSTTDTILDFRHNEDFIQLTDGLSFNDLTFVAGTGENTGNTILQHQGTGENLAILVGILPEELSSTDFLNDDPSLPPASSAPSSTPNDSSESPQSPPTSNRPPTTPSNPPATPTPPNSGSGGNPSNPGSGGGSGDDTGNGGDGETDPGDGGTDPGDGGTETNQPPIFTTTASPQATEDALYTYNIVAADPDAGDNLTITSVSIPDWLTLTDNGDGTATLTGTPDVTDIGTPEIVLNVSDGQNPEVEQRFNLTVIEQNSTFSYATAQRGVIANLDSGVGFTPKYDLSQALKIMPLGDSITEGKIEDGEIQAQREGYRLELWNKLQNFGLDINFVGTKSNGNTLPDKDHQGHPGWSIGQLLDGNPFKEPDKFQGSIKTWLPELKQNGSQPDIILLMIVTNNTNTNDTDEGQKIATQLDLLIKEITQTQANNFAGDTIVSSIPPIRQDSVLAKRQIDATSYNQLIPGVVNKYINQKVSFVDIGSHLTDNDISPPGKDDGLHPTKEGYQKIAEGWYDAVLQNIRADADENLQNIDNVTGSAFNDVLIGNANTNVFQGGDGDDKLTGGGGADAFVYDNPNEGLDTITDFGGDDIFQISASGFGGGLLAGKALQTTAAATGVFVSGVNPGYLGTMAHFLYDTATDILSFDADGNGGGAKVQIAQLSGTATLTANQFSLVA